MMTSTIRKFGVGVASIALVAGMAAPAVAAPDEDVLPGVGATNAGRLSGVDRIATSLQVGNHAFKNMTKPTTVYITNADDAHLIDATTAGKLTDGPLVFVSNNSYVAEAVGRALKDTDKYDSFGAFGKVVAVGGEASISDATLKAVAKEAGAAKTDRIAGKDRYETAVKIADYIYTKAMNGEDGYNTQVFGGRNLLNNTNLQKVYIANGTDSHLVDSMVGGVLDGGPTLLAGPDGSLSEETQAFIKKTLPEEFIALGGEKAVSDATVNNAWLIKALKNDWNESYDIPSLQRKKDHAFTMINGVTGSTKDSRNPSSDAFMGLKSALDEAKGVDATWQLEYQKAKVDAAKSLKGYLDSVTGEQKKLEGANGVLKGLVDASPAAGEGASLNNVAGNFILLYGDIIGHVDESSKLVDKIDDDKAAVLKGSFAVNSNGEVTGFNFADFEASQAVMNPVSDAKADLNDWWGKGRVPADMIAKKKAQVPENQYPTSAQKSYIAIASQYGTATSADADGAPLSTVHNGKAADETVLTASDTKENAKYAASAPLAAVRAASAYTVESVQANLDKWTKAYAEASQQLRNALDKVQSKTVLRLGGKDRYETAAWVANEYMKAQTGITKANSVEDFYVANSMAYADAIVAGQLKKGPILLVPAEGDLPKPVVETAKALPWWNGIVHTLNGYGVGGTRVVPEAQLQKVIDAVNKGVASTVRPSQFKIFTPELHDEGTSVATGSPAELVTINNWDEIKKLPGFSAATIDAFNVEVISVDLTDAGNVGTFTFDASNGKISGTVQAAEAGKKFKLKVTVKAQNGQQVDSDSATSAEITVAP